MGYYTWFIWLGDGAQGSVYSEQALYQPNEHVDALCRSTAPLAAVDLVPGFLPRF